MCYWKLNSGYPPLNSSCVQPSQNASGVGSVSHPSVMEREKPNFTQLSEIGLERWLIEHVCSFSKCSRGCGEPMNYSFRQVVKILLFNPCHGSDDLLTWQRVVNFLSSLKLQGIYKESVICCLVVAKNKFRKYTNTIITSQVIYVMAFGQLSYFVYIFYI